MAVPTPQPPPTPRSQEPRPTPLPLAKARGVIQPSTVAGDYTAITVSYRRLYTSVLPAHLHPPSSSTPASALTCSARPTA